MLQSRFYATARYCLSPTLLVTCRNLYTQNINQVINRSWSSINLSKKFLSIIHPWNCRPFQAANTWERIDHSKLNWRGYRRMKPTLLQMLYLALTFVRGRYILGLIVQCLRNKRQYPETLQCRTALTAHKWKDGDMTILCNISTGRPRPKGTGIRVLRFQLIPCLFSEYRWGPIIALLISPYRQYPNNRRWLQAYINISRNRQSCFHIVEISYKRIPYVRNRLNARSAKKQSFLKIFGTLAFITVLAKKNAN